MPISQILSQRTVRFNPDTDIFEPLFFRLSQPLDAQALEEILSADAGITVFDDIYNQVEGLVKTLHPKLKLKGELLRVKTEEHFGTTPRHEYGVWVFYPWSKKLVHILDEQEFILLRTNRNHYKITPDEASLLATKKLGVAGLSVGHSVTIMLTMERAFGEIRLADFDYLELSNMNRIKAGTHNLGLNKAIMTAREIKEIDPFLTVKCFTGGLSEENLDAFFLDGGKIDLFIEVCDGIDIKIFGRERARKHRIPVVMDTSDRGMLDVERFDLEPDRPIFHDLLRDVETKGKQLTGLSNEEKVPYVMPMIGLEGMSLRMRASMLEVEQSITTWPQLATNVGLSSSIGADAIRRILLGQFTDSGRYYIDPEEVIRNKDGSKLFETAELSKPAPPDWQKVKQEIQSMLPATALSLSNEEETILIEAAIAAPSAGNNQPWKFYFEKGNFFLVADYSKKSYLEYEFSSCRLSYGTVIENVVLQASVLGFEAEVSYFPSASMPDIIARISIIGRKAASEKETQLAGAIYLRNTDRLIDTPRPIDPVIFEEMKTSIAYIEGQSLAIFTEKDELATLRDIIARAEKIRLLHEYGFHDFMNELRWSQEESDRRRDGVDLRTLDIDEVDKAGLKIAQKWEAVQFVRFLEKGTGFEKLSKKIVDSSAAIGLQFGKEFTPEGILTSGRAFERYWLAANLHGVGLHPLASTTFLYFRWKFQPQPFFPDFLKKEMEKVAVDFEKLIGNRDGLPIMLFKMNMNQKPALMKAYRKKSEEVVLN